MYIFKRWGLLFDWVGPALKSDSWHIRELIRFIKPEIAFFLSSITVLGYLLFNPLDMNILYAILVIFFSSIVAYSYNHFKDKEEDLLNKNKLNFFVATGKGYVFIAIALLLSFVFSLFLSKTAFALYLTGLSASVAYSIVKIKKWFLVKNLYTAANVILAFLFGAAAINQLPKGAFLYVPLIFFVAMSVSIIGDLRDYYGDHISGIRTLPVVLGYHRARRMVYIMLALLIGSGLFLNSRVFFPLVLLTPLTIFFLSKNNIPKTRLSLLSSCIFTSSALVIVNLIG